VTHRARATFDARNFVDFSPPVKVLHYLNTLKLARLETEKIIEFSSKARARYMSEKTRFEYMHKFRDAQYDMH